MDAANSAYTPNGVVSARISKTLLNMFSPIPAGEIIDLKTEVADQPDLWMADAIHRANNLSQMSSALGSSGLRRRFGLSVHAHAVEAQALSSAYAELGAPDLTGRDVPCLPLLEIIATRLVALFGDARSIHLHMSADQVTFPADERRALTLIASELIINALKYAFPAGSAGTISVTLRASADMITVSVADDGRGLPAQQIREGAGTGLLGRLAAILAADIRRISTKTGLTVEVTMARGAARSS